MHDHGDVQLGAEIAQELANRGTDFIAAEVEHVVIVCFVPRDE